MKTVSRIATLVAVVLWFSSALAEVGVTDEEIVIGQSAPLSGSFAELGKAYRSGAELYFDHVNRQGGVAGRKVRLVVLDDGYKADRAVQNTRKLLGEHKVFALSHYMFTGVVKATLPLASEAKVPYFAPYTGADELFASPDRYLFLMRASFGDEMAAIVRHFTTIGLVRVALVRYSSKPGEALLKDVEERLAAHGLKLAAVGKMELNSAQAGEAVAAIAPRQPQVVILGISGSDAVAFIRRFESQGARPAYYARSLVSSHQLVNELGPLSRGVIVTQLVPSPHQVTLPVAKEYRALLAARDTAAVPSYVEFEGFIAARILVEGLKRAGRELTRGKLVAALETLKEYDAGGFTVRFAPDRHAASKYVELSMIAKGGRFVQ